MPDGASVSIDCFLFIYFLLSVLFSVSLSLSHIVSLMIRDGSNCCLLLIDSSLLGVLCF